MKKTDYLARKFAEAKDINRQAGRPIVRYDTVLDEFVSWEWDPETLDDQLEEAQRIISTQNPAHPDFMLVNGLANGDLTDWDDNH